MKTEVLCAADPIAIGSSPSKKAIAQRFPNGLISSSQQVGGTKFISFEIWKLTTIGWQVRRSWGSAFNRPRRTCPLLLSYSLSPYKKRYASTDPPLWRTCSSPTNKKSSCFDEHLRQLADCFCAVDINPLFTAHRFSLSNTLY